MAVVTRGTILPYQGAGTAINLHGWNGWIPVLQNQGDEFQRLGQAGAGAQILGTRGSKATVSGWQGFTDQATAQAAAEAWEALSYVIARVVDGFGRSMPRVRLSDCRARMVKTKGPTISGSLQISYRVECSAVCERLPNS